MNDNELKKYFWIFLDLLLAALFIGAVVLIVVGAPAMMRFAGSLPSNRTMSVSAEGQAFVTPDIAEGSFSVISQGINPQTLADNNNQKMSAVVQFLKSQGIADSDIKTTSYDLSPNYRYDENTRRNYITGYTLTQTVTVKMRDLNKVAAVVGGLTPLGVNQIGGINFTVEDMEKYLAPARADAIRKAQAKAADLAAQNGLRLGKTVSVNEYQPGPVPYYNAKVYGMGAGAAPVVATPTLQPGTQEVQDQITLTYEIY